MLPAEPAATVAPLIEYLTITQLGDGLFEALRNQENRAGGLFGGQIFAQALMAAGATAGARLVHSAQASFLRPGRMEIPVTYRVEATRDGGVYSTRTVSAMQGDKLLFVLNGSFKEMEADLLGHSPATDLGWPRPEDLQPLGPSASGPRHVPYFPSLDVRPVNRDQFLLSKPGIRRIEAWFRAREATELSPLEQQAAIAFLSDFAIPFAALSPHAGDRANTRMFTPTLNHSIWFTGRADPAAWIAHRIENRWVGDGRMLSCSEIFDRAGTPVATTMQENVLRAPSAALEGR